MKVQHSDNPIPGVPGMETVPVTIVAFHDGAKLSESSFMQTQRSVNYLITHISDCLNELVDRLVIRVGRP